MANAIYPKWKEAIMQGAANSSLTGTVRAALVDTATYTYSAAHEFQTSLTGVVGTVVTLSGKTYVNGTFDAADVSIPGVTGATAEALVIYIDTGTPATSRLVAYFDTGVTGLPFTPNGGNADLQFNASGIFRLGA
jgi:hypothetical protein